MGSSLPEHLGILKKYGPLYLTNAEYERRLKEMIRGYYRYLAESVVQRRGREFWTYHRRALRKLGLASSPLRIAMATVAMATHRLLRPARPSVTAGHEGQGRGGL